MTIAPTKPAKIALNSLFICCVFLPLAQAAWAQDNGDAHNLPLRGLSGTTSLGVYPSLDKSLLVTPGLHQKKAAVPLTNILGESQITGKIVASSANRGPYQGWLISVKNDSDRPIMFDGDQATAVSGAGPLACVPLTKLAALSILPEQSPHLSKKIAADVRATAVTAVTVGWVPTIRDQKRASGPVVAPDGGRYGLDEQRRQDEQNRFGKRVLWPGDSTVGVIYFDTKQSLTGAVIDVPLSSYYDKTDTATISLHR